MVTRRKRLHASRCRVLAWLMVRALASISTRVAVEMRELVGARPVAVRGRGKACSMALRAS
eukprot:7849115-Pyramimonas_sp.AAC.1